MEVTATHLTAGEFPHGSLISLIQLLRPGDPAVQAANNRNARATYFCVGDFENAIRYCGMAPIVLHRPDDLPQKAIVP